MKYNLLTRCEKCGLTINETNFIENLCVSCDAKYSELTSQCRECGTQDEKGNLINNLCISCFTVNYNYN